MNNYSKLTGAIAPSFYKVHHALKKSQYTHYWLGGGRGSTKSSFISVEIVLGIMNDASKGIMSNAVIYRRVKDTISDSVRDQIKWAIEKLEVTDYWNMPESKLTFTYLPTGQQIRFKGADNEKKAKGIKFAKGYAKYIWYEEVDEFENHSKIRSINQTLMRGGTDFVVFYSYNPPKSKRNWVNEHVLHHRDDSLYHHSDYTTVPREWLGEPFIIEAEHLKATKPMQYDHEYLGKVVGTNAEVFTNVTIRKITDDEISMFDRIKQGLDFGFAGDPLAYVKCHYDKTRKRLYIFRELYGVRFSNEKIYQELSKANPLNKVITCDSAEPRTISELNRLGLRCKGAKKGPDSVDNGIKFLQDLEEIIIDEERCPNTAREFNGYEIETDKDGNLKGEFPDKDNHSIDATRYSLEDEIIASKARARTNRNKYI